MGGGVGGQDPNSLFVNQSLGGGNTCPEAELLLAEGVGFQKAAQMKWKGLGGRKALARGQTQTRKAGLTHCTTALGGEEQEQALSTPLLCCDLGTRVQSSRAGDRKSQTTVQSPL